MLRALMIVGLLFILLQVVFSFVLLRGIAREHSERWLWNALGVWLSLGLGGMLCFILAALWRWSTERIVLGL